MAQTTLVSLEELKKNFAGPMGSEEIAFLRDLQGFIEYAIRNGLSFPLILTAINHDLTGIRQCGNSVKAALADCFTPMVTGYAGVTADSVGEVVSQDGD